MLLLLLLHHRQLLLLLIMLVPRARLPLLLLLLLLLLRPRVKGPRLLLRVLLLMQRPGEQSRRDVRGHRPLVALLMLRLKLKPRAPLLLMLLLKLLLRREMLRAELRTRLTHHHLSTHRRASHNSVAAPALAAAAVPERRGGMNLVGQRRHAGLPVEKPPSQPRDGPRSHGGVGEAQQRRPFAPARGPVRVEVRRGHELPELAGRGLDLGVRDPPV